MVVVHAGLSAVSDHVMVRKVRVTNGMQKLRDRGRQLRTEAGRQLVGSAGGTCHFRFGYQICMLSILKSRCL